MAISARLTANSGLRLFPEGGLGSRVGPTTWSTCFRRRIGQCPRARSSRRSMHGCCTTFKRWPRRKGADEQDEHLVGGGRRSHVRVQARCQERSQQDLERRYADQGGVGRRISNSRVG